MIKTWLLLMAMILSGATSQAFTGQISENFSTNVYKDAANTTAVWNIYLNKIHPPLVASTSNYLANTEDWPIDVGDGSDGSFDPTTYAKFSVGGTTPGNVITIDTSVHPVLNFTKFYLATGYVIEGTGSNPLIIHVLGTFTNLGVIDCSGGNGDNVSADISTVAQGGTSRCGGGAGGNGGYGANVAPTAGVCAGCNGGATNNTPGQPSTGNTNAFNTYPTGGGGGGGYGPAAAATSGGGPGGSAGACTNSTWSQEIGSVAGGPGGGSGGGGGGAYLNGDSQKSRGGGGGGGGGVIVITAVGDIDNEGTIFANGGSGGAPVAGLGGSGGGGGGGGTIVVQTAGAFTDNGAITANSGGGGVPAGSAWGGGNGCNGRGWLIGANGFSTGTGTESPGFGGPDPGQVHYRSAAAYVAQSKSFDSLNTSPTYLTLASTKVTPNASTVDFFVAGSNDNFVSDDTGFVPLASMAAISGKRYFRFKVQLQLDPGAGEATTPVTVGPVTVTMNGTQQSDFQFNPACGTFGGPGDFFLFLFSCYFFGCLTTGRLRRGIRFRQPTSLNSN